MVVTTVEPIQITYVPLDLIIWRCPKLRSVSCYHEEPVKVTLRPQRDGITGHTLEIPWGGQMNKHIHIHIFVVLTISFQSNNQKM